ARGRRTATGCMASGPTPRSAPCWSCRPTPTPTPASNSPTPAGRSRPSGTTRTSSRERGMRYSRDMDARTVTLDSRVAAPGGPAAVLLRLVWSPTSAAPAGTTFALDRGLILVGRAPGEGGLALASDPAASRVHAAVERQGSTVTVEDRGSRNGTWVDGGR